MKSDNFVEIAIKLDIVNLIEDM